MLAITPTTLLVVDGLNAAAAGDVVFRGCHLHIRVVWQVNRNLHQTLSVRTCT